jgi:hypothetical protein
MSLRILECKKLHRSDLTFVNNIIKTVNMLVYHSTRRETGHEVVCIDVLGGMEEHLKKKEKSYYPQKKNKPKERVGLVCAWPRAGGVQ